MITARSWMKSLAMLLTELLAGQPQGKGSAWARLLSEGIPIAAVAGILVLISALSASILPPWEWLLAVLAAAGAIAALLWNWFVRLHSRLQIALLETLRAEGDHR